MTGTEQFQSYLRKHNDDVRNTLRLIIIILQM